MLTAVCSYSCIFHATVRDLITNQHILSIATLLGRHYAVELGMELRAGNNDPAIMKYLSELLDVIESVRIIAHLNLLQSPSQMSADI